MFIYRPWLRAFGGIPTMMYQSSLRTKAFSFGSILPLTDSLDSHTSAGSSSTTALSTGFTSMLSWSECDGEFVLGSIMCVFPFAASTKGGMTGLVRRSPW